MQIVFPVHHKLRGKLYSYNRLYAFPSIPEKVYYGKFIILDSGAFALHKKNKKMNNGYMAKLNVHYQMYGTGNKFPVLCIAPDEFLNPISSILNYQHWKSNNYSDIVPVIQFDSKTNINEPTVKYQMEVYKNNEIICVSNPSLSGKTALMIGLDNIFNLLKKDYKVKYIHVLGAGWSKEDLSYWKQMKYFDSLDSIAYYNNLDKNDANFTQRALENIRLFTDV